MTDEIFFHIGLHKTATTWFQRHIFSKLPGVEFMMTKRMDDVAKHRANGSKLLVSHESLSGTLSSSKEPGDNKKRLAASLAGISGTRPNAAIIIGFREHGSWLGAAFAHKAKKEGVNFERYAATFSRDDLSWCKSLDLVEATSDSVFPFLYEELVQAPEKLIADLCAFLGTEPPRNLDKLLAKRENPSPRSRFGQLLSRPFYQISYAIDKMASVNTRPLRDFGARLGAGFDDDSAPRRAPLDQPLAAELKADWEELLARAGRRRGRDFSVFGQQGQNEL